MKKSLRPDVVWNLSLAVALIFFSGTLAVALLPKPDPNSINLSYRKQLDDQERKEERAKEKAVTLQAQNKTQLWAGDSETIEARSLDSISRIARARGVKLSAFRPQRPIDGGDLQHLPFLAIVEGRYPAIVSFLKTLEQPLWKLALNSVQITATDGASDTVSASVVVVAYRDPNVSVKVITNGSKG